MGEIIDKTQLAVNWSLLKLVAGYAEIHAIILSTFVLFEIFMKHVKDNDLIKERK